MSQDHISLAIPQRCHENWDQMSPQEKGRFCHSCQKIVVDFTLMSDQELLTFFKQPSGNRVCGRLHRDQLERSIEGSRRKKPWLRYLLSVTLPALLITKQAIAQGSVRVVRKEQLPAATGYAHLDSLAKPVENRRVEIAGNVQDTDGQPLAAATVRVTGTNFAASTGVDGAFVFFCEWESSASLTLEISAIGYEQLSLPVRVNSQVKTIELGVIKMSGHVLNGEVVVVRKKNNKWWKKSKGKEQPVIQDISTRTDSASIRIFPNPVDSRGILSVQPSHLEPGTCQIEVTNAQGQAMFRKTTTLAKHDQRVDVALPYLLPGQYFVQFISGNGRRRASAAFLIP